MAPAFKYLIYALVDPRSGQWRYIGKSCSGLARPRQHLSPVCKDRNHKANWVRSLAAVGITPRIEVLEELASPSRLADVEQEWIAAARGAGVDLTNETDGGEGLLGRRHGDSTKLKMALSRGGLSRSQRDEVVRLYRVDALSLRTIGLRFHTGSKVILRILKDAGVTPRSKSQASFQARASGRRTPVVFSDSQRQRISGKLGGRPFIDEQNRHYLTIHEASRALGVDRAQISGVLKGRARAAKGHVFRYLEAAA